MLDLSVQVSDNVQLHLLCSEACISECIPSLFHGGSYQTCPVVSREHACNSFVTVLVVHRFQQFPKAEKMPATFWDGDGEVDRETASWFRLAQN